MISANSAKIQLSDNTVNSHQNICVCSSFSCDLPVWTVSKLSLSGYLWGDITLPVLTHRQETVLAMVFLRTTLAMMYLVAGGRGVKPCEKIVFQLNTWVSNDQKWAGCILCQIRQPGFLSKGTLSSRHKLRPVDPMLVMWRILGPQMYRQSVHFLLFCGDGFPARK